jgi:hypothetical protein
MTQERIRELLNDVADAVPAPDVAEGAWRRSVRVRRRRVAGSSVLAVGVIAAVVAVVGVVGDGQAGLAPPREDQIAVPLPPPEAAKAREPDAQIAGAAAWIGPSIEEEERLPRMTSVLPGSVDLTDDVETTDAPGRSIAAFAASDSENQLQEVMLVDHAGEVSKLDVSGLDLELVEKPDPDSDGTINVLPLNISSLSPNGKSLVLAQNDEVVLFDLVNGGDPVRWPTYDSESYYVGWTHVEGEGWQIQLVLDVMDPHTGVISPRDGGDDSSSDTDGPVYIWPGRAAADGRVAQAVLDRPVPKLESEIGTDPVLIQADFPDPATEGVPPATLALPVDDGDHVRPRSRVVAWFGRDVAFQSQDYGTFRVLGWDTDTGAVKRISDVELPDEWDTGVIASWAYPPSSQGLDVTGS